MRAINRKLLRDLWQTRGQVTAIALVIGCGIATFVLSLTTIASLEITLDAYYERQRFGDVFARLKRAPDSLARQIADIPGVAQVETRVVQNVTLDVAGLAEPAAGMLISIPEVRRPILNDLYLRNGRWPEPGRPDEVLASEGFTNAHAFAPGDSFQAIINGRKQTLRIVGVALSPEHIYSIRPGDILPDDKRYGVFWMNHEELSAAFDMEGAFNDVSLKLAPGAIEDDVIERLDRLTRRFGGQGAFGRKDQPSHRFIKNEIEELHGMAVVIPTIFLGVAAFLLNVVLSRMINTQREQIAALKAFGYARWQIGVHYLKFTLCIVFAGTVAGSIVGARLGESLTHMYTRFFHFPVFGYHLDPKVIVGAFGVSTLAAVIGALAAVRRAVNLPPAEAMRPEPPASYQPTIIERIGLQGLISPAGRMVLRHLERQPFRSFLSAFGMALAVAVLILGNFMLDAVTYVLESEFEVAQRQDLLVSFVEPRSSEVLYDLQHLPGVQHCQPFRGVSARLRHGQRARRLAVIGVQPGGRLYRVMNLDRAEIVIPPDGVVISQKLGELLEVGVGDLLTVEVLEGERPIREVPVRGLVTDFNGLSAYMDIEALNRLLREGPVVSGAYLAVDDKHLDELYTELKATPRVSSVTLRTASLTSFRETVAENLLRMRLINVIFASIIAFGVVYNSARISLAERSRELATLRVIGFTRGEISLILFGELAILTLAAIPLGLWIGYHLAGFVVTSAYNTELFRIPLIVSKTTYGFAATVTLTAAILSALVVRRMIDHLDLVAVLKSKE